MTDGNGERAAKELHEGELERVSGGGGAYCSPPAGVREQAQCQQGQAYCATCQYRTGNA